MASPISGDPYPIFTTTSAPAATLPTIALTIGQRVSLTVAERKRTWELRWVEIDEQES